MTTVEYIKLGSAFNSAASGALPQSLFGSWVLPFRACTFAHTWGVSRLGSGEHRRVEMKAVFEDTFGNSVTLLFLFSVTRPHLEVKVTAPDGDDSFRVDPYDLNDCAATIQCLQQWLESSLEIPDSYF